MWSEREDGLVPPGIIVGCFLEFFFLGTYYNDLCARKDLLQCQLWGLFQTSRQFGVACG